MCTSRNLVKHFPKVDNQNKDHKILLVSDSHGRGCAERIKDNLSANYEVCGYVKPGMTSDIFTKTTLAEINN